MRTAAVPCPFSPCAGCSPGPVGTACQGPVGAADEVLPVLGSGVRERAGPVGDSAWVQWANAQHIGCGSTTGMKKGPARTAPQRPGVGRGGKGKAPPVQI